MDWHANCLSGAWHCRTCLVLLRLQGMGAHGAMQTPLVADRSAAPNSQAGFATMYARQVEEWGVGFHASAEQAQRLLQQKMKLLEQSKKRIQEVGIHLYIYLFAL